MNTAFALRCSWRFSVDSTGIKSLLSNLSFTSTALNAHRSVTESFLDESVLEGNRYVSVLLKKSLCLGTKTAWTGPWLSHLCCLGHLKDAADLNTFLIQSERHLSCVVGMANATVPGRHSHCVSYHSVSCIFPSNFFPDLCIMLDPRSCLVPVSSSPASKLS